MALKIHQIHPFFLKKLFTFIHRTSWRENHIKEPALMNYERRHWELRKETKHPAHYSIKTPCRDNIVLTLEDVTNSSICTQLTVNHISLIPAGFIGKHLQRWTKVKDDGNWSCAWVPGLLSSLGVLFWIKPEMGLLTSIHDHAGFTLQTSPVNSRPCFLQEGPGVTIMSLLSLSFTYINFNHASSCVDLVKY